MPRCHSCGMPLSKDPCKGGKELDGNLSTTYCSYCYEVGIIIWPKATAKDMKKFVYEKCLEMGYWKQIAWFFAAGIPKLKRWRA